MIGDANRHQLWINQSRTETTHCLYSRIPTKSWASHSRWSHRQYRHGYRAASQRDSPQASETDDKSYHRPPTEYHPKCRRDILRQCWSHHPNWIYGTCDRYAPAWEKGELEKSLTNLSFFYTRLCIVFIHNFHKVCLRNIFLSLSSLILLMSQIGAAAKKSKTGQDGLARRGLA